MSTQNEEIIETGLETVIEPAAEVNTPVVEEPKRYEYQPTDEDGRPVGGKQVILYITQEELVEKIVSVSARRIRLMRTLHDSSHLQNLSPVHFLKRNGLSCRKTFWTLIHSIRLR